MAALREPGCCPTRLALRRDCATGQAPPATTATPLRGGDGHRLRSLQYRTRILARHTFASSRHISPELCLVVSPSNKRGRREGRAPAGTRGPLCEVVVRNLHSGIQVKPKHPAIPAQWFDGLCRALLGERCTIAPVALRLTMRAPGRAATSPQRLTPACGRQDHTILPYADHTGRACDVPRSRLPALRSTSHQCGPRPPPSGPRS